MLRDRKLAVLCLFCVALLSASCVTEKPSPPPSPAPPAPLTVHGYHLVLYDVNGEETNSYDLGPNDIIRDDPLHQEIWFRVHGQEKHFHGSYKKERR